MEKPVALQRHASHPSHPSTTRSHRLCRRPVTPAPPTTPWQPDHPATPLLLSATLDTSQTTEAFYLRPVVAIPRTRYFCPRRNSMNNGTSEITDMAIIEPHELCPDESRQLRNA